jgi:dTDP-4-dehydrorhamnose 3,5-epimerase-like enzyme
MRFTIGTQKVVIQTIQPLYSDQRGWIVNAFGTNDGLDHGLMQQPRLVSAAPNIPRGNHFHDEIETTILLNNRWHFVFANEEGDMRKEIDVDATQQPYVIIIPEFIAHAVVNRSDTTAGILHSSEDNTN